MLRDNRRRSVAGSVKSGRSSISTLTNTMDFSYSSGISAITMDSDLMGSNSLDRSSFASTRSYSRNFGPKLRTMHEQQRASDPDMEEVQEYLDAMRVAGNDSNQRFTASHHQESSDALCHCPRRKSSSSSLDYRTAHSQSVGSYFTRDECFGSSKNNPLHNDVESRTGSFFTSHLEEEDEVLPLSFTPRSRSSQRSSQRNSHIGRSLAYYGAMMSSISLDLGDIFDDQEEDDEEEGAVSKPRRRSSIFDSGITAPSVDVSPQVAKRRSSLSTFGGSSKDLSAKIRAVNLILPDDTFNVMGNDDSNIMAHPEGSSGKNCLPGDERFETRCEESNSITKPTRRVSSYTLNLRPIQFATCTTQGQ